MEVMLLVAGMALLPIYSFASGGVQFSHMVLALLIAVRLIRIHSRLQGAEITLLALLVFVILREGYSIFVQTVPIKSVLQMLYVAFAAAVVITFSRLPMERPIYKRAFVVGFSLAIVVAVLGIYRYGATFRVDEGELTRSIGTFNNPNQLAYFAVCIVSIASLLYLRKQIGRPIYLIFLLSSLALAIAALSKAGLLAVGSALLIAAAALLNRDRLSPKLVVLCALIVVVVVQLYMMGVFNEFYFVHRLEGIGGDRDDSFTERGYVLPHDFETAKILFGIGQANVAPRVGHEVHSTFWSFMLKYGVFGFGLFLLFWYQWTRRIWNELGLLGVFLVVMPASIYGLTHNGSRFAIFWVLIGVSLTVAKAAAAKRANVPRSPLPYAPVPGLNAAIDWRSRPRQLPDSDLGR